MFYKFLAKTKREKLMAVYFRCLHSYLPITMIHTVVDLDIENAPVTLTGIFFCTDSPF